MSFADVTQLTDHIRERMGGGPSDDGQPFFTPYRWRPPSEIPPRDFLYGRHYIRQFVSATFAPGAAGKSNLIMAECMAMAAGKALLGVAPQKRLRTAFWNGEDPLLETERRVAATSMHYGLCREDLEEWFYWGSGRDKGLVIAEQTPDGTRIIKPVVDRLVEGIRAAQLDVLCIDPFVSCHRVTENDNNAIDAVAKEWGRVADITGIAVELSHHTTKAAIGRDVRVEDGRGGGALLFAVRSARVLNTMTPEEAESASVEPDRRRFYFRVNNGKANLSPPSDKCDWFHSASVELGNAQGLKPQDNVGVVEPWSWPGGATIVSVAKGDLKPRSLNAAAATILAAYWRLVDGENWCLPPPVIGVRAGMKAVQDGELRKQAVRQNLVKEPRPEPEDEAATNTWKEACKKAWQRGCAELEKKKRLRFEDGLVWFIGSSQSQADDEE